MFLQYAPAGAMLPLFSYHLDRLRFTPAQIGWACATQALAALAAPLLAGQFADRWWSAERCLAVYTFLSSGLLWMLAGLTGPTEVFWTCLAFWLVMVPALTLGTSLSFAHLQAPERDFGRVRLWGTVGWIVPGWLLSFWLSEPAWIARGFSLLHLHYPGSNTTDAFRLAALLAFVFGLYALTLPHTPPRQQTSASREQLAPEDGACAARTHPRQQASASWAPLAALGLLRRRAFAVYFLVCLGWCVTIAFPAQMSSLLLAKLGIPERQLPRILTVAQAAEIASLAILPLLVGRIGIRGTMLLGLGAWSLALLVWTAGQPLWLVVGCLSCHGLCICCFLVAGQVFLNSQAPADIRSSAQGLLAFVNGLGMLAGNLLAGWVREQAAGSFPATFAVGAVLALVLVVVFGVGFVEEEKDTAGA